MERQQIDRRPTKRRIEDINISRLSWIKFLKNAYWHILNELYKNILLINYRIFSKALYKVQKKNILNKLLRKESSRYFCFHANVVDIFLQRQNQLLDLLNNYT